MNETPDQPGARTTNPPGAQSENVERRPYSVVVVDDHAMFRTGVKAEIGRSVAVVGEAADADRAIAVVLQTQPDVVLLDVHLPGGGESRSSARSTRRIPNRSSSPFPSPTQRRTSLV